MELATGTWKLEPLFFHLILCESNVRLCSNQHALICYVAIFSRKDLELENKKVEKNRAKSRCICVDEDEHIIA